MSRFVRTEVQALRAYTLDLSPCRFKLDQNEVPWELPRRIKEEVARRLVGSRVGALSGLSCRAPARAAGRSPRLDARGGAGRQRLERAARRDDGRGRRSRAGDPRPRAELRALPGLRAPVGRVATGRSGRGPTSRCRRTSSSARSTAIRAGPVLVASPNNPTGEAIPPATIARWAAKLADADAPLLLDNAYGEFCRHDYRPLLARHPNLVIFRTFSKAWSLAGLRLGYLLAAPELVSEILKVKLPYNLGQAGAIAGELALDNAALVERRVRLLVARREQWRVLLAKSQDEVFASEANFLSDSKPKREKPAGKGLAGGARDSSAGRLRRPRARGLSALLRRDRRGSAGGGTDDGRTSFLYWKLFAAGAEMRRASIQRQTKETKIELELALDARWRRARQVPSPCRTASSVTCWRRSRRMPGSACASRRRGTPLSTCTTRSRTPGIVLGEALAAALGERRGVVRFAHAYAPLDEALARAVIDLSGRGFFVWTVPPELEQTWVTREFPLTLVADFFQAFADRARLTLHLTVVAGRNPHHVAEACFKAVAVALRQAVALRAGAGVGSAVPSTKGTLVG